MKPYKLSFIQAPTNDDKEIRRTFCESILEMVEGDEAFFSLLVFSEEATFYLCGPLNPHNIRIWETHHIHETLSVAKIPLK